MKVLIVCSANSGRIAPFIIDQAEALEREGVVADFFTIEGRGIKGYLTHLRLLKMKMRIFQPDLLHAHYGLSGLLANLQRKVPVITTYHGSDINNDKVFRFSKLAIRFSAYNIFVSEKNLCKASKSTNKAALIPCGVDTDFFKPVDKWQARKKLNLCVDKKYILFSGAFSNTVKNPKLAIQAVSQLNNVELLELKGYSRDQVALFMNAVDAVLMTSFTEGSPQFIKEAMACNCPVVSVPVGDVSEIISGIDGCYLTSYNPVDVSEKLNLVINIDTKTNGRIRIIERGLDAETIAKKIVSIYRKVVDEKQ